MHKPAAKFTAILLLFLFLEKAGMRLWIHQYFHHSVTVRLADQNEKNPGQHLLTAGCDCMDYVFLPVTHPESFSVCTPGIPVCDLPQAYCKSTVFSSSCPNNRHRGPPCFSYVV